MHQAVLKKVKHSVSFRNFKPNVKKGNNVTNAYKRNIFSEGYISNWNIEFFKVNQVIKNTTTNI